MPLGLIPVRARPLVSIGWRTESPRKGVIRAYAPESAAEERRITAETINTTTYLVMLKEAGQLRWHEPRVPVSRGFSINGWPHTTAVLAEVETGDIYVVDPWFHDNGVPAETVSLDAWMCGWSPDDAIPAVSFAQASDSVL